MKKSIAVVLILSMAVAMLSGAMSVLADEAPAEETESVVYDFADIGILDVMEIPESYKKDAEHQGRVERIDYNNGIGNKYMYVYLPYGYDDGDQVYNTFYVMHGGNGRPEVNLQEGHSSALQKLYDHAFEDGVMDPFIIVAPTWNPAMDDNGDPIENPDGTNGDLTRAFAQEFVDYVLPLVDGNYRTYAGGTDEESLRSAREHRAFAGFSMGAVTTWDIFLQDLEYVAYFIPESGDCWAIEETGGATYPEETSKAVEEAAIEQGFGSEDFYIYAFTGTADVAWENLGPQILAMQENPFFLFGQHVFFGYLEGGEHIEPTARRYAYTALHYIWQE